MTANEWEAFCNFKKEFKAQVDEWTKNISGLLEIEKTVALECGTPEYSFENPIVYNTDLDRLTKDDEIKLIVIGDNPGKDEQLNRNQKYLVGQAGKIAEGYFKRNPELGIDFRKNVIILNKTPVHSAKTNQLKKIVKIGGRDVQKLVEDSQIWMAKKTAELHKALSENGTELWLVGYSELKEKGIFTLYKNELKASYDNKTWENVYVFQHFSMNRFSIDLNEYIEKNDVKQKSLQENIRRLGKFHKEEIF